ncbi:FGGY-family carbohydrate kinase [Thiohalorhabdus sp. Cl-TMA]|uniref:FGGY-family carbohydrate kinase n=1 Tax=Thiohalorhabdus methylotrophus TaxID=3242694 RepID=A0ABV4TVQ3_9GAMM
MSGIEPSALFLGADVGTSGVRVCALTETGAPFAQEEATLPAGYRSGSGHEQDPESWWEALVAAISKLAAALPEVPVRGLALDSTSGTLLLADARGAPLGPALMYDDRRSRGEAERIARNAPADSGAHGASSSLAKLLYRAGRGETAQAAHALHAADWLTGCLLGRYGVSDENNALKLGYDPVRRTWPDWVHGLVDSGLLPEVVPPGARVGELSADAARRLGLPGGIPVMAGTTDSVAGFLATGAGGPGEAVTSLGSTLALKVVGEHPVFAPEYGVYSHRLGERWLPGGASNSGGAVLRRFFSDAELTELTPYLHPERPTGLDYLPLPGPGERFPDNDPDLEPRLEPRPAERAELLQGLLEGIAAIEARGYRRLAELGAPNPDSVRTVGGGARNPAWTRIRGDLLGVPMLGAGDAEAACGTARLAAGRLE